MSSLLDTMHSNNNKASYSFPVNNNTQTCSFYKSFVPVLYEQVPCT